MNKLRPLLIVLVISLVTMLTQSGAFVTNTGSKDNLFVWVSSASNSTANYTRVSHPLVNNNDASLLFVTPSYGVGGTSATPIYYNRGAGVYYNNSTGIWEIFNEDSSLMSNSLNAAFHVVAKSPGPSTFTHVSAAANISAAVTYINHPLTNNNSNARLFITHTLNGPGGTLYTNYTNKVLGVFYSNSENKWAIFFQDQSAMQPDLAFNVYVAFSGSTTFTHTSAGNEGHITTLNHIALNNNPWARIMVTQNYSLSNVYNNHHIGVWYDFSIGRWTIFNQDLTIMSTGAGFNINIVDDANDVVSQDLVNGSFEVESGVDNTSSIPQGWFSSNPAQGERLCNLYGISPDVAFGGDCALVMVGAPSTSATFAQTLRPPGGTNTIAMSALVRGVNQTGGGTIFARVFLTNGTRGILRLSSTDINAGTYAWRYLTATRTFPSTIQRVRISIVTQEPTGTLYVDNVRLSAYNSSIRQEAPLIPMP